MAKIPFGRIGGNYDILNNQAYTQALNHASGKNIREGKELFYGKPASQLSPEQFSTLSPATRGRIKQAKDNNINNPNLIPQATVTDINMGPYSANALTPFGPKTGGSMNYPGTPGSSAGAGSTGSSSPSNSDAYNWFAGKMGFTPKGAAAPDYSGGFWSGAKNTASWFATGSTGDKFKKAALGTGIYAGANLGLRGLNGGGASYNNQGQRDIAGIPFV